MLWLTFIDTFYSVCHFIYLSPLTDRSNFSSLHLAVGFGDKGLTQFEIYISGACCCWFFSMCVLLETLCKTEKLFTDTLKSLLMHFD